ncbi:MAG: preprotein translocase subunit SecE [Candidatus Omnitrophica bacterium]|nr:preprotein translocase subunit SecE [Candidatus Omnitrophota bacterium]
MPQTKRFFQEVKGELKKVSWPTRSELINSTIAVIVGTILLGIFIGIVDFFLSHILGVFIR